MISEKKRSQSPPPTLRVSPGGSRSCCVAAVTAGLLAGSTPLLRLELWACRSTVLRLVNGRVRPCQLLRSAQKAQRGAAAGAGAGARWVMCCAMLWVRVAGRVGIALSKRTAPTAFVSAAAVRLRSGSEVSCSTDRRRWATPGSLPSINDRRSAEWIRHRQVAWPGGDDKARSGLRRCGQLPCFAETCDPLSVQRMHCSVVLSKAYKTSRVMERTAAALANDHCEPLTNRCACANSCNAQQRPGQTAVLDRHRQSGHGGSCEALKAVGAASHVVVKQRTPQS